MRYFPLMLYASAENRDWGVSRIEPRSSSSAKNNLPNSARMKIACSPSGSTAPSGWQCISAGPVSWLITRKGTALFKSLPFLIKSNQYSYFIFVQAHLEF
jgi:hypothetical protein